MWSVALSVAGMLSGSGRAVEAHRVMGGPIVLGLAMPQEREGERQ
jgi:hypothetical protein